MASADFSLKPVVFLAFANDKEDSIGYLRNLGQETRRIRQVLEQSESQRHCELVIRTSCTANDIFEVFQDPRFRDRIAIFHYGGHANGYQLLLESNNGTVEAADASGLSEFLAQQESLQLVFLNGCSTKQQTQNLLDANISAVISTSSAIDDLVATDFACRFYQGLAGGATIQKAFREAEAAIKTTLSGRSRGLYFEQPTSAVETSLHPWGLYVREGAENVKSWNLPEASNNPLFGLPKILKRDLPDKPYRYLERFADEDAEVFFGRGADIRRLYDLIVDPDSPNVILFYGQSGVGKSSLLDAGLNPRLENPYEVKYVRRPPKGFAGAVDELCLKTNSESTSTRWTRQESKSGKPLLIVLDQVEEMFINSVEGEISWLVDAIKGTLSQRSHRPSGKLVVSFRKEWLAEIESLFGNHRIARSKFHLKPLNRQGIVEAVEGPWRVPKLAQHFGLKLDSGLGETIAEDLLSDNESALAPTLQILLTKMWERAVAKDREHPYFSLADYQSLKREGILLRDFLQQQLAQLKTTCEPSVESGLALDILAAHTTPLGTADQMQTSELSQLYSHVPRLQELLYAFQNLHLLSLDLGATAESGATRLAHDTIAPLVRERFDESDKPGQRARRLLDARVVDWETGKTGIVLDSSDLETVENGERGTRKRNETEERLVQASRRARDRKSRNRMFLRVAFAAMFLATGIGLCFAIVENRRAKNQLVETEWERNRANELAGEEKKSRESAEEQRLMAQTQAAEATLQRAFAARDLEHHRVKAATLFSHAAWQFQKAGDRARHDDALIASGTLLPKWSVRHPYSVRGSVRQTKDGKRFTLASDKDTRVQLWQTAPLKLVKEFEVDSALGGIEFFGIEQQWLLVWTLNGQFFLLNREGETIGQKEVDFFVGKVTTGPSLKIVVHPGSPFGIVPDEFFLLDLISSKKPIKLTHAGYQIESLSFSNDEAGFLSSSEESLKFWNLDGSLKRSVKLPNKTFRSVLGPDRKTIHSWKPESFEVEIRRMSDDSNTQTDPIEKLVHQAPVDYLAFNRAGDKIVTLAGKKAHVWDVTKQERLASFSHSQFKAKPEFCGANDEFLLTVDAESNGNQVRISDIQSENVARLIPQTVAYYDRFYVLNPSRDRVLVHASDGQQVVIHDLNTFTELLNVRHDYKMSGLFSEDTSSFLSYSRDGIVRQWDLNKMMPKRRLVHDAEHDKYGIFGQRKLAVSVSKSKRWLMSSGLSNDAFLWDIGKEKPIAKFSHDALVIGCLFSPDDSLCLSWDRTNRFKVWDIAEKAMVSEGCEESGFQNAAFLKDSSFVSTNNNQERCTLWDAQTGKKIQTFSLDHDKNYYLSAIFPTPESLGDFCTIQNSGSSALGAPPHPDNPIRFWAAKKEACLREFNYESPAYTIAFSPNGEQFVTSHANGESVLWAVDSDKPVQVFYKDNLRNGFGNGARFINDHELVTWNVYGAISAWEKAGEEFSRRQHVDFNISMAVFEDLETARLLYRGTYGKINMLSFGNSSPFLQFQHIPLPPPTSLLPKHRETFGYHPYLSHREFHGRFVENVRKIVTWDATNSEMQIWNVPDPNRFQITRKELEARTCATLDDLNGDYRVLSEPEWRKRFEQSSDH